MPIKSSLVETKPFGPVHAQVYGIVPPVTVRSIAAKFAPQNHTRSTDSSEVHENRNIKQNYNNSRNFLSDSDRSRTIITLQNNPDNHPKYPLLSPFCNYKINANNPLYS